MMAGSDDDDEEKESSTGMDGEQSGTSSTSAAAANVEPPPPPPPEDIEAADHNNTDSIDDGNPSGGSSCEGGKVSTNDDEKTSESPTSDTNGSNLEVDKADAVTKVECCGSSPSPKDAAPNDGRNNNNQEGGNNSSTTITTNRRQERINRKKEEMNQLVNKLESIGNEEEASTAAIKKKKEAQKEEKTETATPVTEVEQTGGPRRQPGDDLVRTPLITTRPSMNTKTAAAAANTNHNTTATAAPSQTTIHDDDKSRRQEQILPANNDDDGNTRPGAHPAAGRAFGDVPHWGHTNIDNNNNEENSPAGGTTAAQEQQYTSAIAAEEIDLEQEITERVEERLRNYRSEDSIRNNILREAPLATVVPSGEEEEEKDISSSGSNRCKKRTKWFWIAIIVGLLLALLAVAIAWGVVRIGSEVGDQEPGKEDLFELEDDTVLATVPETICYERIPFMGGSDHCLQRPQELGSGVTNLIAQAYLWKIPQANISIVNAGEAKTDIVAGNFTGGMAKSLLPFPNTLVVLRIKGFNLKAELERLLQVIHDQGNDTYGAMYPYGAGIRYWVNMTEEFPNRLSNIQINPRLEANEWTPINYDATYTVVTNSYLAKGGGFSEVVLERHLWNNTHIGVLPAFVEYCQEHKVLYDPPREQYSTQFYIHNPILFDLHDDGS